MMCENFGTDQFWASTSVMRAAGTPWNNSATANPATNTGGVSFSGLTCPCFIIFQDEEAAAVATIQTAAPFVLALPSGFLQWQGGATTASGPKRIDLTANDNYRPAANDNMPIQLSLSK
jgi:hypothetical protein